MRDAQFEKRKYLIATKKTDGSNKAYHHYRCTSNYSSHWRVYALAYFFSRFLNSRYLK